ncbi:MAG: hypothetical protein U0V54_05410 [Saprospiraceae bacterium]
MMKHFNKSALVLIGFVLTMISIQSASAQLKDKVRNIQNGLSKDHVRLGNGSVLIVPPENFTSVSGLNGLMQESSNTSIIALELNGSLESTSRMFGAKAMREKNINVLKEEELYINGNLGYYIEAEQATPTAVYTKYMLSFGVDSITIILNASMPKTKTDSIGAAIKKSIFSVIYRKFVPNTSQPVANYEIDVTNSPFQLARSASNSQVYTTDGKMPTENPDKTALLATRSEGRLEFRNKVEFATDRLKQLPAIVNLSIQSTEEKEVNGQPAVEIVAYGEDRYTHEKKLIYQLMSFAEFTYYLVIGTCSGNFDTNLELFRKVALTLRLK